MVFTHHYLKFWGGIQELKFRGAMLKYKVSQIIWEKFLSVNSDGKDMLEMETLCVVMIWIRKSKRG
jgi:hypothetical protein